MKKKKVDGLVPTKEKEIKKKIKMRMEKEAVPLL
jgi:hypothetical protein